MKQIFLYIYIILEVNQILFLDKVKKERILTVKAVEESP